MEALDLDASLQCLVDEDEIKYQVGRSLMFAEVECLVQNYSRNRHTNTRSDMKAVFL